MRKKINMDKERLFKRSYYDEEHFFMKKIYILITISILIGCSDKSPNNIEGKAHEKKSIVACEILVESDLKESSEVFQIFCSNPNITKWYGFNEAIEDPSCQIVNKFNLHSYKCEVSKNAFGAGKDAILLENNDQRIFSYSSLKDCKDMLEVRNSNAP